MADDLFGDMDVEYATSVADRAIRSMTQQSVPVTPGNFSVWFDYAMGTSPALRKTFDILIGNKRKFDASINRELYATFVKPQSGADTAGDFPEQMRGVISSAKEFLATAISDNRSQIEALGQVASEVTSQVTSQTRIEPLSMLMIDIDHFKKFNDTYGHQVGDQVLRLVAKVLLDNVGDSDLAARYGGEELIAVLPGADLAACVKVAERVRLRVSEARLTRRTTGQAISSVTVSIGVAQFRLTESAETMIERCDRGLYQAKRSGRNRTVTENDIEGETAAA